MGQIRRSLPNVFSLSRIPASLVFLLVFSTSNLTLFWVSMAIIAYVVLSDFLDGFLARRWGLVSEQGYYLDGLGDKSFTVAACLVVARYGPELTWLMWGLLGMPTSEKARFPYSPIRHFRRPLPGDRSEEDRIKPCLQSVTI